jgi:hypothetical protein
MKGTHLFNIFFILLTGFTYSQVPTIEWQKTYGGTSEEIGYSICFANANGYVVTGYTKSSNGYIVNHHGNHDLWLINLDSAGNLLWNKCYGGIGSEFGYSIILSISDTIVIAGSAHYNSGDVSGAHFGVSDFWILKVDQIGFLQWQKCLGGTQFDEARSIIQTSDSGYLVTGVTMSPDYDVTGWQGGKDMWVVKLTSGGVIQWSRTFGGTDFDEGVSCVELSNGIYLVGGSSDSYNGNLNCFSHLSQDAVVVALDTAGNLLWKKCYGGNGADDLNKLVTTPDGGFYISSFTRSIDGDITNNHGQDDYWLIKADSLGNIQWEKCFGGINSEQSKSACLTSDGGVAIVGYSGMDDGMVSGSHGGPWPFFADYWVVKTDNLGNLEWGKCLGGSGTDIAYDVKQTIDGGYVVVGSTDSKDGDITDTLGGMDVWVVKLSNPTAGILIPESGIMEFSTSQINDQIILRFFSKRNIKCSMKLFDLNGKLISENEIKINEGINYHSQNCSGLPEGMYIVEIVGKNVQQREKLFVRKGE